MNCALCSGYLALKHDVKSRGIRMPYCAGCRPRNKQCSFLKKRCGLLRNSQVRFCFECADYPCTNLVHLNRRYQTFFRMSMLDNLDYIQRNGMNAFLNREAEKWKCPDCGDIISCHNGTCFHCHLDNLKNKRGKYRWEDD